MEMNTKFI